MFCCIHDPNLASLLAGDDAAMPDANESLVICGVLALEILCLLALGSVPW